MHAAVPNRRRMRQYGGEQGGTKASSRRDADAARNARGRCAPRRPRPRARIVRGGRATRTHVSRSSRRNRSDAPRSHVTPARMPSCARCRSRTARVSRSIVNCRPALETLSHGTIRTSPRPRSARRGSGCHNSQITDATPLCAARLRDGSECRSVLARGDLCEHHARLAAELGRDAVLSGDQTKRRSARQRTAVDAESEPLDLRSDASDRPSAVRPALALTAAEEVETIRRVLLEAATSTSRQSWATCKLP